jgi:hypothetical protein
MQDHKQEEIPTEKSLMNLNNSPKTWTSLPYLIQNLSFSTKDTLGNGLCFFYTLKVLGISDYPRTEIINYIESGSLSSDDAVDFFRFWGRPGDRDDLLDSYLHHLKAPPGLRTGYHERDIPDCWADDADVIMATIVFKIRLYSISRFYQTFQAALPFLRVRSLIVDDDFMRSRPFFAFNHQGGYLDQSIESSSNHRPDHWCALRIESQEPHCGWTNHFLSFYPALDLAMIQIDSDDDEFKVLEDVG